jgi:inositol phosphorylceramide mannosyltransferase catalytic subunit
MRRGLLFFILVNALIITTLVRNVFTLLTLLVEDASADAIHLADLQSHDASWIETRPQLIPKIIHQTYRNESIPAHWKEAHRSCVDWHPDYEYIVGGCSLSAPLSLLSLIRNGNRSPSPGNANRHGRKLV